MSSRNTKYNDLQKLSTDKTPQSASTTSKAVFRGFIPANAIRTKKGYVGSKLDSLWARYMIDSFVNDDGELANAAVDSCLCHKDIVVEGGEFGTPFMLGNYGFFAVNQFTKQAEGLQLHERKLAAAESVYYLSDREWAFVDAKIGRYARYGQAKVEKAVPGDTLVMLAIREAAFEVAATLIRRDFEPLAKNSEGEDMLELTKERYVEFAEGMRKLHSEVEEMARHTIVPTDMEKILAKDDALVRKVQDMLVFLEFLVDYFRNIRMVKIEQDKWAVRKAELRHEV